MKRSWLNEPQSKNLVHALLGVTAMGSIACTSDDPAAIGDRVLVEGDGGTISCIQGSTKSCFITIGLHNGVLTCYEGTRTCTEEGVWTECSDGTMTNKQWSGSPGSGSLTKPLAVTSSSDCDNPCDPSCQNFEGDPDVVSIPTTEEAGIIDYVGGSLSSIPPGLVKKGIIEPCEWGAHCQFNHHCTDVATNESCTSQHSKCEEGSAFQGDCIEDDPCVAAICAEQPSCCASQCAHDPCVEGVRLAKGCSTCVTSVCENFDSKCCTQNWDEECVAAIATHCPGSTCDCAPGDKEYGGHCYRYVPESAVDESVWGSDWGWADAVEMCHNIGPGWDLVTISSEAENDEVHEMLSSQSTWIGLRWTKVSGNNYAWRWSYPAEATSSYRNWDNDGHDGRCQKMRPADGTWRDDNCDETRPFVCEGGGTVLSGSGSGSGTAAWDSSCVAKVASVCDATCDTTNATDEGVCVPWEEGEVDESCVLSSTSSGIDLSLAVPCDGKIIVCNHGTEQAPANIPIVWYPGNSPHYGVCSPYASSNDGYCQTDQVIPPGTCISVDCGLFTGPQKGNNRQIYINPDTIGGQPADGYIPDECSCLDNWTEARRGVPCLSPVCAEASAEASLKTVNMYLIVDKSTSMGFRGTTSSGDCDVDSNGTCDCESDARWTGANVDKLLQEKGALATSFESLKAHLEELRRAQAAAERRAAQMRQLVERFRKMADAGQLQVAVRRGRMVLQLPNDVLFDSGRAAVKAEGKSTIQDVAAILKTIGDRQFQIAGHTDNEPIRSSNFPSNWYLSTARAIKVVEILVDEGVDPKAVSACGYGEFDPVVANDSDANKSKNRRIEIVIQPNVDELLTVDNKTGW